MFLISTLIAKTTSYFFKLLKLGSGNTWPGHIVLKLFPNIKETISKKLPSKIVLITGTNGKTTTSNLLAHILSTNNIRVLHNNTGANLINGIVSTILLESNSAGDLPYDVAVFEVDEFSLSGVCDFIKPTHLAFLNLSRDQLDRHWEVDLVLSKWRDTLKNLPEDTLVFTDPTNKYLSQIPKALSFNDSTSYLEHSPLKGSYNAKNVNCAVEIAKSLDFDLSDTSIKESLKSFFPVYGRGEKLLFNNKNFTIYLAKNPESVNQNLEMLSSNYNDFDTILYVLNDRVPDGHDVSWIYDVKPNLLGSVSEKKNIYVSGDRSFDMATRLNYANVSIDINRVSNNLSEILNLIKKDENSKSVVVLPNYSAMLDFRKIILGRKIL